MAAQRTFKTLNSQENDLFTLYIQINTVYCSTSAC